ncbi:MAG TPA: hypothetical protein VII06_05150 [Chloroflexota bacterium]|jgi:hypothetical protein
MPASPTLAPGRALAAGETPWWLAAPALHATIERQGAALGAPAHYQVGDAILQVATDEPALLEPLGALYADCAVAPPFAPGEPRVRCSVRRSSEPPLLALTFEAGAPREAAASALSLLHPGWGATSYAITASPLAGWQLVGTEEKRILATSDARVLIDSRLVPDSFVAEYLAGAALAAQPDLVVIHGATVGVGDAGLLLAGRSHVGKTTTALHLAARGHTLLGDELAGIRLATREIVPVRQTMSLRPGPRAPALQAALGRLPTAPLVEAAAKTPLQIGQLFPSAPARPVKLRAAFFLQGFAERPTLTAVQPTLDDLDRFAIVGNEIAHATWGRASARWALRLLGLRQTLSQLSSWRLTVGAPDETAALIEQTMEDLTC